MKLKRIFLVLMILVVGVILASCKSKQGESSVTVPFSEEVDEGLPEWYVNNMIREYEPMGSISYTATRVLTGFDYASQMVGPYFVVGKLNEFDELRYGVYDSEEAKMVVNANYGSITYYGQSNYSVYSNFRATFVRLTDDLGRKAIYNLTLREFAISFVEADSISYTINYINQVISSEVVIDGEATKTEQHYEFDVETNKITFIAAPEEDDDYGQVGIIGGAFKMPLDEYGFEGYSLSYGADKISMFLNDELKYSINLPIDYLDQSFFVGKYFYFQFVYELPEESTEYDFFYGSQKYQVSLYRFAIEEGILREVNDLGFIISNVDSPLKDENDRFSYMRLRINRIWNKMLGPDRDVLLNEELEIVHILEESLASISSITKIDANRYYSYDGSTFILFDENFVEKFRLEAAQNLELLEINGKIYIQARINYYGVIDLEGNIMIPFEYNNRMTFDGITAQTVYNVFKAVYENPMLNKQVRVMGDDEDYIGDVFIEEVTFDDDTGDAIIKYYDLSNNLLIKVPEDYYLVEFYAIYGEHTGIVDGQYVRFYNAIENKSIFYYIKVNR